MAANLCFEPTGMRQRKKKYFEFVRQRVQDFFTPEGHYRPNLDPDPRLPFWIFPALIASDDPAEREFALRLYAAPSTWEKWDIFITSNIASNLRRERDRLSPALIRRSEEHLARFVDAGAARTPSSGANDYMFHGFNDNMPAMAARALIFAGEMLDRRDLLDHGLFRLEGLCAHFQRRGLLSEYNSGTYTPISLTSLMDIAEMAKDASAREMARACCRRILLDILLHWHPDLGACSGSSSRAYVADATLSLTNINVLRWYWSGDEWLIDPVAALSPSATYDGPIHHGPDRGFCLAQFVEFFVPDYADVPADIIAMARQPRVYPFALHATTDAGRTAAIQTRLWQQRLFSLGTASCKMWAGKHHHLTLRATVARRPMVKDWRDRLAFWHLLRSGGPDLGEITPAGYNNYQTPTQAFHCCGSWHTAQKRGSAMVLGHVSSAMVGQETSDLSFSVLGTAFGQGPDEAWENETPLAAWDGETQSASWHFLRFGEVYVGLRLAGMLKEKTLPLRRSLRHGYLRLEMRAVDGRLELIDQEFRKWLDLAYVLEVADREECGDFSAFRRQCLSCVWQCIHWAYRNSIYRGRHGELQIVDSIEPDAMRFIAIDGKIEEPTMRAATGLPAESIRLFDDARIIRQRGVAYRFPFTGTPFYPHIRNQVLVADAMA